MPECNRCGASVPSSLKLCPSCQNLVNPAGHDLLVTEQPKPPKKGTARGGIPNDPNDRHLELEAPPWEPFGTYDETRSTRSQAQRTGAAAKSEPGSITPRDDRHRCEGKGGKIKFQQRKGGQSVFQLAGINGLPPIESDPVPGGPRSAAGYRALHAFVRRLRNLGLNQCGKCKKWYWHRMVMSSPATARGISSDNLPKLKQEPKSEQSAPTRPKGKSKRKEIVQRIQLQQRPRGKAVFRLEAPDEAQILESKPFPLTPTIESAPASPALAAHREFMRFLEICGWKRHGRKSRWYAYEMRKVVQAD